MQETLWCSSENEEDSENNCKSSGCDASCGNCDNDKSEPLITGWINIYDSGGCLQSNSGIYTTVEKATESGKLIKGYITSVKINFPSKLLKTLGNG